MDLTSVPFSSSPASYLSRIWKSRPAFRLVAISAFMGTLVGREKAGKSSLRLFDELDFALDDLLEGDVGHAHARAGRDQGRAAAVQLADALGHQIDEDQRVGDDFR